MNEKENILKAIESSKTLGEVAEKCGFSIVTLFSRMKEYDIKAGFKRGRRFGARKEAKQQP